MNVTKEEARKLECRVNGVITDEDGATFFPYCSGPGCMHWEWGELPRLKVRYAPNLKETEEPERPDNVPTSWEWRPYNEFYSFAGERAGWVEPIEEAEKRRRGRCGLGG